MAFPSLLAALLLEHFRPLASPLRPYQIFADYAAWLERHVNGGRSEHGVIAWFLALLPPVLGVYLVYELLEGAGSFFAWAWNAAVLYLTMGFKYFSNISASIAAALRRGDLEPARAELARWWHGKADDFTEDEVARVGIEQIFLSSHRQMFGVMFWFVLLSGAGPVGAVLYRLASILRHRWDSSVVGSVDFARFSGQAFRLLDWLPARATAVSYAIVGDFEDAVNCWREQAAVWGEDGIVAASGAGALGVRLGGTIHQGGEALWRPELGTGDEAGPDFMESAVSLVWRAVALWLALLLLVLIASLAG
jgi:adenosylcobinamide-phosphate synthase